MGDPIRIRKKFHTPGHPWDKSRIEAEAELVGRFGLKNKREIWKANTLLKNFTTQAKALVVSEGEQFEIEKDNLLNRIKSLGLGGENPNLDTILSLKTEDILERRLQTVVFKRQLARSIKQARQFIVHNHIMVNGEKITVPSYLVRVDDVLSFSEGSSLSDEEHPERYVEASETEKEMEKNKQSAKKKKEILDEDLDVDDELLEVSEEDSTKTNEESSDEAEKKDVESSAEKKTAEVKKDE